MKYPLNVCDVLISNPISPDQLSFLAKVISIVPPPPHHTSFIQEKETWKFPYDDLSSVGCVIHGFYQMLLQVLLLSFLQAFGKLNG